MSLKRGYSEDDINENSSKHSKLEKNEKVQHNHNDTKKVVDKQPIINENVSETYKDDDCYSDGEPINRCVKCSIDIGDCNPRQYCSKLQCNNYVYFDTDSEDNEDNKTV